MLNIKNLTKKKVEKNGECFHEHLYGIRSSQMNGRENGEMEEIKFT